MVGCPYFSQKLRPVFRGNRFTLASQTARKTSMSVALLVLTHPLASACALRWSFLLHNRSAPAPAAWHSQGHCQAAIYELNESLAHFAWMLGLQLLPINGFSIEPSKVKLLAGEHKATETSPGQSPCSLFFWGRVPL